MFKWWEGGSTFSRHTRREETFQRWGGNSGCWHACPQHEHTHARHATEHCRFYMPFFGPEVFPCSPPLHFLLLWMNLIGVIICAQTFEAGAAASPSVDLYFLYLIQIDPSLPNSTHHQLPAERENWQTGRWEGRGSVKTCIYICEMSSFKYAQIEMV